MQLTDINTIKSLLARHGFKFSKGLGQNFLCDPDVPAAIAHGAGITPDACVMEVGPGIGTLSAELAKLAHKVVAVELDSRLPAILKETMRGCDNFGIVEGDILKTNIPKLCSEHFPPNAPVLAVANLPYYITSPAISALIDSGCFKSITVMVQREVAMRMCAAPGTRDYGAFSVYIAYHTAPRIILDVPSDCFIPAPKVDSAVVRMDVLDKPPVDTDSQKLFFVIKAAFSQRRKTLLNCLASAMGGKMGKAEIQQLLADCGFDANIRGETLGLVAFAQIAEKLCC